MPQIASKWAKKKMIKINKYRLHIPHHGVFFNMPNSKSLNGMRGKVPLHHVWRFQLAVGQV
jgi:hypothetical protein